jgi:hypothetical protein
MALLSKKMTVVIDIFIDRCKKNACLVIRTECTFMIATKHEGFYSLKDVKISQCEK